MAYFQPRHASASGVTATQPGRPNDTGAASAAPPPLALDPGTTPVIRYSASVLAADQNEFVRQLHYDVTSLMPDQADGQGPDLWAFCERMVRSLLWVALTDQPLGVMAEALRQVGGLNWADGISDAHYGNFAHALVQTVHYLSESDWSASTGSAWISYFMWVRPHLLAGAQQAAAHQAAAQQKAAPPPGLAACPPSAPLRTRAPAHPRTRAPARAICEERLNFNFRHSGQTIYRGGLPAPGGG